MLVLLIDTSLKGPLVALADARLGRILETEIRADPQDAAAELPRLVQGVLTRQHTTLDKVTGLIVGTGPGSFTGIKIGLAFAYGLHRAHPSFGFYASSALGCFAHVALDANLWMLPATATHGYFASRQGVGVVNLDLEAIKLESPGREPLTVNTTEHRIGCLGVWPRLDGLGKRNGLPIHSSPIEARAHEILNAMLQDFIANSRKLSDVLPMPQYLRKSAPEEKAEKKA